MAPNIRPPGNLIRSMARAESVETVTRTASSMSEAADPPRITMTGSTVDPSNPKQRPPAQSAGKADQMEATPADRRDQQRFGNLENVAQRGKDRRHRWSRTLGAARRRDVPPSA